MAAEQGTGQHKHKSTEEPYPHHEAPTTKGEKSGADGKETKSATGKDSGKGQTGSSNQGGSGDLQEREYRGPDGEQHHHTRTYIEQHGSK